VGQIIQFALLGLGLGALYSMASQGLILIYRGSGVLNFAYGAIGVSGAFVEWQLSQTEPTGISVAAGVLTSAALGVITYLFVMRPLRQASSLTRVVATLGVLITLQSLLLIKYGANSVFPSNILPARSIKIAHGIVVSENQFILLGIALVLSLGLAAFYKYTKFGLATTAVAENERASAALGWSPDLVATINWGLGSALAGIGAILVVPIVTLQVSIVTSLLISAIAAALVASFQSFMVAFAAAMVIGVIQTEFTRFISQPGLSSVVPFVIVILILVVRGRSLPLRDFFLQKLPMVGDGRIKPVKIAIGVVIAAFLFLTTPETWVGAFTVTIGVALVCLSIVVLTGYAGQLSLAQFALAGFGAWIAGRLMAAAHQPFWISCVAGIAGTVLLGIVFALPAVRTRGINLAVITLGLGSAMELMLFDNTSYTGGFSGTVVPDTHLFGIDVSAVTYPRRYAFVALIALVLASLAVANVRRGRSGRRLIAVRTNERAAAALGVSVPFAKLYAFGLSAAIAAVGGIILAFTSSVIDYSTFTSMTSISLVAWTVIGGIGFVVGPIVGGTFAPGALGNQITSSFIPSLTEWVPLIGGVSVILLVLQNQNGSVQQMAAQAQWLANKLRARLPDTGSVLRRRPAAAGAAVRAAEPAAAEPGTGQRAVERIRPQKLVISDLSVRYGSVVAVSNVSLTVEPGKILGVIGPNGAGKTSLIDAVTGFTKPTTGTIALGDSAAVEKWPAAKRARAGLGRSFQSLELFEDTTVIENLRTASDPHDLKSYVLDLVYPARPSLPAEVIAAIEEFGLSAELERKVQDLPYGRRRLLAVARAVATLPSALLLDEPAAGLSEEESRELAELVRRLADDWGMGILLVEHDMNFVMSVCDDIAVLDFGVKITQGPPSVVRNDRAVIAAYLGEEIDDPSGTEKSPVGPGPSWPEEHK
jgi:ABC-type branched-subunit amino acid transport system ATPase component/branched-subunit amino acid ABC-type transport system permease component